MNENLDLTKILDGCPVGTKFYSTIYGEISFKRIELSKDYPLIFDSDAIGGKVTLTENGAVLKGVGECIVFPSKNRRNWSKFERFWEPKIERFDPKTWWVLDKVLYRTAETPWVCSFFSRMVYSFYDDRELVCTDDWLADGMSSVCIPYNDETKHLLGTKDDCPDYYKWWKNP